MKKILILGGGFGGMYTAHYLLKKLTPGEAKVTLVNNTNYFLFVPLLHEVATGNIRTHNIVEPIREVLDGENFEFYKTEVKSIDLKKKRVKTDSVDLGYDYLVIALGSETNFYSLPGNEKSYTLKSLNDAYRLRNHVIDMFEKASLGPKKRKNILSFAVIGGGPTGVELACELSDWIYKHLVKEYPVEQSDITISLIDPNEKVLRGIDEELRDFAMKTLRKKRVNLVMGGVVKEVAGNNVTYEVRGKRKKLEIDTVIWVAGVKAHELPTKGIKRVKGTLPTDEYLRVQGHGDVFALGDNASYQNPRTGERPPPTAQLAHQQAKRTAENIMHALRKDELEPFIYKSKGFLASLGKGEAIAHINGFKFHGFFAWWLWRTIYLTKVLGFQNKLRIVIDWTFDLFFPRDTSQV